MTNETITIQEHGVQNASLLGEYGIETVLIILGSILVLIGSGVFIKRLCASLASNANK